MANANYERSYGTARTISSILELVGWIIVGAGVLLIFAALGTIGGYRFGLFDIFLPLAPGISLIITGLFMVMAVQIMRATVDSAEMTREMLHIARHQNPDFKGTPQIMANASATPAAKRENSTGKTSASEYFGYSIVSTVDGRFEVDGQQFPTIGKAQAHVRTLK